MPDLDAELAHPKAEVSASCRAPAPGARAEAGQRGQPDEGPGIREVRRAALAPPDICGVGEHAVLILLGGPNRACPDRRHAGLNRPDRRVGEGPPDRHGEPLVGACTLGQDPDDGARWILAVPVAPAPDQPEGAVEDLRSVQPRRYDQAVGLRIRRRLVPARVGRDHHHARPAAWSQPHRPGHRQHGRARIDEHQPLDMGCGRRGGLRRGRATGEQPGSSARRRHREVRVPHHRDGEEGESGNQQGRHGSSRTYVRMLRSRRGDGCTPE